MSAQIETVLHHSYKKTTRSVLQLLLSWNILPTTYITIYRWQLLWARNGKLQKQEEAQLQTQFSGKLRERGKNNYWNLISHIWTYLTLSPAWASFAAHEFLSRGSLGRFSGFQTLMYWSCSK